MKKVLALLSILALLFVGMNTISAQTPDTTKQKTDTAAVNNNTTDQTQQNVEDKAAKTEVGMHQMLIQKFIEGGPGWMTPILFSLIFGLALALERIIYLTLATTDTKKFLLKVEASLNESGIEGTKDLCRNTRGPVASIFYEGLMHYDEGIEVVEKTVGTYGSIQSSLLERGLTWIALFISLAPMLGFLGTVVGMVQAFDAIAVAGDVSASIVAAGMKVALITTVFGLITAIILQLFYNYLLAKVEGIVTDMEDASVSLIDLLYKFNKK